jgi:uncharacterized protein
MTEPPRPPGDGNSNDPTAPFNPYAANDPAPGSVPPASPPPPPPPAGGYAPPPPAGGYAPPPGGGYQPPAGGGYQPPPGGYQQPPQQYGYGQQPGGFAGPGTDDKTWIMIAHFGGAAGAFIGGGVSGWIAPLIALLARGNQSPVVRAEAIKALNFQILWSIIALVGWISTCLIIGFIIGPAAWLVATIFGVIAGVKANNNEPYSYPMSVQIIK